MEGVIKAVKRSNGKVVGSVDADLTVGYPTISDEALEAAKDGEYVFVESATPVISTKQFEALDEYVDGGKVTFTNGMWTYEVRVSGQEAVNMLYNERAIREVSSKFEDQNFMYVSFPGGPAFDFTGTMTIDVSEVMEDFGGNFHVYRYLRGVLEKIDATVDADNETVSFETKNLGRFVLTDKEIADGTVVDESFVSLTAPWWTRALSLSRSSLPRGSLPRTAASPMRASPTRSPTSRPAVFPAATTTSPVKSTRRLAPRTL